MACGQNIWLTWPLPCWWCWWGSVWAPRWCRPASAAPAGTPTPPATPCCQVLRDCPESMSFYQSCCSKVQLCLCKTGSFLLYWSYFGYLFVYLKSKLIAKMTLFGQFLKNESPFTAAHCSQSWFHCLLCSSSSRFNALKSDGIWSIFYLSWSALCCIWWCFKYLFLWVFHCIVFNIWRSVPVNVNVNHSQPILQLCSGIIYNYKLQNSGQAAAQHFE